MKFRRIAIAKEGIKTGISSAVGISAGALFAASGPELAKAAASNVIGTVTAASFEIVAQVSKSALTAALTFCCTILLHPAAFTFLASTAGHLGQIPEKLVDAYNCGTGSTDCQGGTPSALGANVGRGIGTPVLVGVVGLVMFGLTLRALDFLIKSDRPHYKRD
ncbi:hypothetical protein EBR96_08510 [bacterium]|nr:hypothetical protein [bacterium]